MFFYLHKSFTLYAPRPSPETRSDPRGGKASVDARVREACKSKNIKKLSRRQRGTSAGHSTSEHYTHISFNMLTYSSSCPTVLDKEMPPGVNDRVTFFFISCSWTISPRGLDSALCFQRNAQRLTTLWRWRDLCGTHDQTAERRPHAVGNTATFLFMAPTGSWRCCVRSSLRSFTWAAYVRMQLTPFLSSRSL